MAIIYTYPNGPSPLQGDELIVISDVNNSNATRNTTAQAIADLNDFKITLTSSTGLSFTPNVLQPGIFSVDLAGTLAIGHGGTDATNQQDAVDNITNASSGGAGQVLTTDGTNASWQTVPTPPIEDLATTLAAGNTTGGTDIVLQDDIVESGGNGLIRLGQDSTNYALLSTDSGNYATTYLWVSDVNGLEAYGPAGVPCNLSFGGNVILRGSTIKLGTTGNTGNLGELDMDALTAQRKFDFQDEDGVIPVGPAWNTLIANPTAGEDGYVLTWVNASNEYQLLSPGAISVNTIYNNDDTLTANRTVGGGGTRSLLFDQLSSFSVNSLGNATLTSGTGTTINNGAGDTTINDNLAFYSGLGNNISDINSSLNGKVIPTREWVQDYTSPSIYDADDTIGTNRNATLTDTLTWTNGSIRRNVNSMNVVEVTQESDFGTVSGGNINLAGDTTYIVRGEVTCSNTLTANGDGIAIIGENRNLDKLVYTGTAEFIQINDYDFTLRDLWLSATTTGSLLISATNVTGAGFNDGRTKVFEVFNCQFRNCFDVWDINGFDLVDVSNSLFFYVQAPTIGLRFRDTSKIEFSSCELIRWFDETTTASPSGWATCSMIELRNNNLSSYGAVNINGCIIHPQQTQNGIDIGTTSTTGFGTISSNAFINVGLTTGEVFLPQNASSLPDYSQAATYNYDIFANQGILNSTSGCVSTLTGNATTTSVTGVAYSDVDTGGGTVDQASVRFTVNANGVLEYNATKQIYCSIHASVALDSGGNDNTYTVALEKNSGSGFALLPGSESNIQFDGSGGLSLDVGTIPINYGTLFNEGDQVKLVVKKASGGGTVAITITDYQLVIRE